jgi:hypothetical protein
MASLSDWQTRKARLDSQISQINELVHTYEKNTRATDDILRTVSSIEERLASVKNRKQDAEASASTFDREFIERKTTFPDPFYPDKIYTIQDFTMFLFFVSYIILFLALALTVPNQLMKILLAGGIGMMVIIGLLYSFA